MCQRQFKPLVRGTLMCVAWILQDACRSWHLCSNLFDQYSCVWEVLCQDARAGRRLEGLSMGYLDSYCRNYSSDECTATCDCSISSGEAAWVIPIRSSCSLQSSEQGWGTSDYTWLPSWANVLRRPLLVGWRPSLLGWRPSKSFFKVFLDSASWLQRAVLRRGSLTQKLS